LILLHGFALHAGLFAPLVPELARRFRVHAVDLPGHGYSPRAQPCSLAQFVAEVAGRFRAEREPMSVLGWSLGGAVAMRWAMLEPARVRELVLLCTTPRFVTAADWPQAMAATTLVQFADELLVAYRLTLQRFLSLQVQGSNEGRAVLANLRARLFERGAPAPDALAETLAMLAQIDLRDEVRAIRAPTLVVTGDRDTLTPRAAGEWLADAIPRAVHANIEGAAHAPFLSHPSAFAAAFTAFVDRTH
jgi:pimeloyl-[acyl-carrier protein] methyl ester esterase